MTQYGFSEASFRCALKQARARQEAELREAARTHPAPLPLIGARAPAKPVYFAPSPMVAS